MFQLTFFSFTGGYGEGVNAGQGEEGWKPLEDKADYWAGFLVSQSYK